MAHDKLIKTLGDALLAAKEHLDYCGYGDPYERECAVHDKLPEQVDLAAGQYERFVASRRGVVEVPFDEITLLLGEWSAKVIFSYAGKPMFEQFLPSATRTVFLRGGLSGTITGKISSE